MGDAALEVLRDLGADRRHNVSNPDQRNAHDGSNPPQQAGTVNRPPITGRVNKWLDPTNFESDIIAESLPDLFSGQGYRGDLEDQLRAQNPSHNQRNGGGHGDHGGHGGHGRGGGHAGGQGCGGGNVGGSGRGAYSNGSRPAPPAPLTTPSLTGLSLPMMPSTRVPFVRVAPRASATTSSQAQPIPAARPRATQSQAPVAAAVTPAGTPPATPTARSTATSASIPAVRTRAAQDGPTVRGPATARAQNSPHDAAPATLVRMARPDHPAGAASPSPQTAVIAPTPLTNTGRTKDPRIVAYIKMAEYYAAHPGKSCDTYYGMFPDRRIYLDQALKKLDDEKKKATSEEVKVNGNISGKADAEQTVKASEKEKPTKDAAKGNPPVAVKETPKAIKATAKENAPVAVKETPKTTKATAKDNPPVAVKETPKVVPKQENVETDAPNSSSPVDSSPPYATSVVSKSTEASAPTPPAATLPTYGKLVVSYYDAESNHLTTRNINVNAPIQANLQITSRAGRYDPRALEGAVQTFAKQLRLHNSNIRLERGDDGLWQEIGGEDDDDDDDDE